MTRTLAAVAALAFALAAPAVRAEFVSGSELLRRMGANERIQAGTQRIEDWQDASFANGFVTGVFDVGVDAWFCARPNITVSQIRRVVHAYLQSVPQRLDETAQQLATEAFRAAFPCPPQQRQQAPSRSL
jgi:hypothetical protein